MLRHRPGVWWWPLRLAFGAFFAHTALLHRELDERGAKGLHRFATTAYPFLEKVPPQTFASGMVAAQTLVAGSLLVPVVPPVVGAASLTAFGTGLMGMYLRVPGLRRANSPRPTDLGMALAKDSWMVAAGLSVLLDAALSRRRSSARSQT